MLRIESTDRLEIEKKRGGDEYVGRYFSANQYRAAFFCRHQGDSYMKQVLCSADALVGFRASMVSALLCAATLSGPVSAAPPGNSPAENNPGLEEIVVTAEKREST